MGDEEKKKSVDLQKEIEKEQEYQNQMNMIYNCPIYFEQYSNDLEYQEEYHHHSQFLLNPQIIHRTLQCISSLHLNLVLKVNWFIFNQLIAPVIPQAPVAPLQADTVRTQKMSH